MYSPLQLAESFISAGELDDALIALNEHLAGQPDDAVARRLRIDVLLRLPNRAREALADLRVLPELTQEDLVTRCGALLTLGSDVELILEQGYRRYPHNVALADLVLTILYRRDETDPALELLAQLPETWQWQRWRGDFHALKGDYSTAAAQYGTALDQLGQAEPNALREIQRAAVLLKRAEAYRRLKQFADAESDYRAAEAIVPDDPMIPFNRGLLIVEQGNLRGALPLCRDALDRAPDALRDLMRDVLYGDPRYHMLAQALLS
jgi:tetratricopeptide (TPR) repeat protein